MSTDESRNLLNLEGSGLSLAVVVSIVGFAVAVTVMGSQFVSRLESLEQGQIDRWQRQDEVIQALETKLRNPNLVIPDPRDQTKNIGSTPR